MKKLSLKKYKKVIKNMPRDSPLRNQLHIIYVQIKQLVNNSKIKHANPGYYQPRIDGLCMTLRIIVKNFKK